MSTAIHTDDRSAVRPAGSRPAYYLGRPASFWLRATGRGRRR